MRIEKVSITSFGFGGKASGELSWVSGRGMPANHSVRSIGVARDGWTESTPLA